MRSVERTIAICRAEIAHTPGRWHDECLGFSRWAAGAPLLDQAAIDSWNQARYKHRRGTPPRGSFVFFQGGEPTRRHPHGCGHIGISDGDGYFFSTDFGEDGWHGDGRVRRIHISAIARHDGLLHYLGWTEDLNGQRQGFPSVHPKPEPVPPPAAHVTKYHLRTHDGGNHGTYSTPERAQEIELEFLKKGIGTSIELV